MGTFVEYVVRFELPDPPRAEDLPEEDGIPLESSWHRSQINLLLELVYGLWPDRRDFVAGGNMFIYYRLPQRGYRGPDFFVVKGVDGSYPRQKWIVWLEKDRFPNVIVELASPTTIDEDLGPKRELYERVFETPEYFCLDPATATLQGWRLDRARYVSIEPDEQGWLWSEQLGVWFGLWDGVYLNEDARWLRLYDSDRRLVPTPLELERRRADDERRRADRLAERLRNLGYDADQG